MPKIESIVRTRCDFNSITGFYDFGVHWQSKATKKTPFPTWHDEMVFAVKPFSDGHFILEKHNYSGNGGGRNSNTHYSDDPKILGVYHLGPWAQRRMALEAGDYACELIDSTGWPLAMRGRLVQVPEAKEFFKRLAEEIRGEYIAKRKLRKKSRKIK